MLVFFIINNCWTSYISIEKEVDRNMKEDSDRKDEEENRIEYFIRTFKKKMLRVLKTMGKCSFDDDVILF